MSRRLRRILAMDGVMTVVALAAGVAGWWMGGTVGLAAMIGAGLLLLMIGLDTLAVWGDSRYQPEDDKPQP